VRRHARLDAAAEASSDRIALSDHLKFVEATRVGGLVIFLRGSIALRPFPQGFGRWAAPARWGDHASGRFISRSSSAAVSSSVSVRPIIRFGVFFAVLVVERILVVPFAPPVPFGIWGGPYSNVNQLTLDPNNAT